MSYNENNINNVDELKEILSKYKEFNKTLLDTTKALSTIYLKYFIITAIVLALVLAIGYALGQNNLVTKTKVCPPEYYFCQWDTHTLCVSLANTQNGYAYISPQNAHTFNHRSSP
jgi:hypothetical protein